MTQPTRPAQPATHASDLENHTPVIHTAGTSRPTSTPETRTCVWPTCTKPLDETQRYAVIHLCNAHAKVAEHQINLINGRAKPMAVPQPRAKDKAGTLYVLRIGDHIKIGYATKLHVRLGYYPPIAVLLATAPGTEADEEALHLRFAHLREAGREWYRPDSQLDDLIAAWIEEHGAPGTDPHRLGTRNATHRMGPSKNKARIVRGR